MSGSYTQIYLHFVFNVEGKQCLLPDHHSDDICRYITGAVQGLKYGHKMLRINSVADHIHFLVSFRPLQSISDFARDVKAASSKYIKNQSWMQFSFMWMEGYGCFSIGNSGISELCRYIDNQKEHHKKIAFEDEYRSLLKKYDVVYNSEYFLKED